MTELLPEARGVAFLTQGPNFRDWKPLRVPVAQSEYQGLVAEITTRLLADVGTSLERWTRLIKKSAHIRSEDRGRVVALLEEVSRGEKLPEETRNGLWDSLKALIGLHRECAASDWALPGSEVDQLEEICSLLTPKDEYFKGRWLFEKHRPDLGSGKRRLDRLAYEAELADLRLEAVAGIYRQVGLGAVRALASESVVPWQVGVSLANGLGAVVEEDLLTLLTATATPSDSTMASAYFSQRFASAGWPWLTELLSRRSDLADFQKAWLLSMARDYPKSWEIADGLGEGVSREFWERFGIGGLGANFGHVELVARRLIDARRFGGVLELFQLYIDRKSSTQEACASLMASVLEEILKVGGIDWGKHQITESDLGEFFDFLFRYRDLLGVERLAALEWAYMPTSGSEPNVPALYRSLAASPRFFVEVVSAIFWPHSNMNLVPEGISATEENQTQHFAERAWRLLRSWRQPPGLAADGSVDAAVLRSWIAEARVLLRNADRLEVGEIHIGQMLALAFWPEVEEIPAEIVRDILEELQNERLERGFKTAKFNQRGASSRGLEEGGAQERELSTKYREAATRIADRWPRTARILRSLADGYAREASLHDEEAERFRSGLD